jgi:hypothetical protein
LLVPSLEEAAVSVCVDAAALVLAALRDCCKRSIWSRSALVLAMLPTADM